MEIDAAKLLGLMTRTVGVVDRDGKPAKLLVAGRAYPTSVEDLWDAVTSAERIPRWFLPITGQLRVAGRYQLEGNAGGDILECEPPRRFAITWEYGGDVSWVELRLVEESADLDLLVVGSRGYGPFRSTLIGGVSGRVVRAASCPVLVCLREANPAP